MAKKNLIFFDIDGTLIDGEKHLPQSTKEAINLLRNLGHEVAIATGRAPFMFEELRKELDIHTYVSFNGQYVVWQDRVIYSNPLQRKTLIDLTIFASENHHPMVYVDQFGMMSNVLHHDYITESLGSLRLSVEPIFDPDTFKEKDIFQSQVFCQEEEEAIYEKKFKEFRFVRWHPLSVDVDPAGGTKAKGIEIIMEHLGYSKDQVYAFGDELNDIEMLSFVPNSVAMGNAHPSVKKIARYVTKPVDQDGIFCGLKMVGLLP